jgi:phage-related protein
MIQVVFFEKNGESQVRGFLEDLRKRMGTNKDARIQYSQAASYIQLLSDVGTGGLPRSIAEYIENGIWELRPGNNRIFFFFCDEDGNYVLLHQFRKKSQKTPQREIRKAESEREEYLQQRRDIKGG